MHHTLFSLLTCITQSSSYIHVTLSFLFLHVTHTTFSLLTSITHLFLCLHLTHTFFYLHAYVTHSLYLPHTLSNSSDPSSQSPSPSHTKLRGIQRGLLPPHKCWSASHPVCLINNHQNIL